MPVKSGATRRLRAIKMMEAKALRGMTTAEVAKEFNVSVNTVERTLTWAQQADIFASYEDKILQGLVPLAVNAVEKALQDGNAKVALEILKGVRLLRATDARPGSEASQRDDDLATYIAAKRDRAQLQANTVEGQILEGSYGHSEQRLLEAGTEVDAPADPGEPAPHDVSAGSVEAPDETAPSSAPGPLAHGGEPRLAPDATHPNAPAHTGPVDTGV